MEINQNDFRYKLIEAAKTQLGVKYHKDARVPNVAFDCVQFVGWCYEQALGSPVRFPLQGSCSGFTDTRILDYLQEVGAQQIPLAHAKWGDIIVWNYRDTPHHTGMLYPIYGFKDNRKGVIHSCAKFGKIVAHPLAGEWAVGSRFNSTWTLEGILF